MFNTLGRQRGLTFIGFLFACALVGFFALVIMKLYPLYYESFKVSAAMEAIAKLPDIGQKTKQDIETAMLKNFEISQVDRFTGRNIKEYLKVKRNSDGRSRTMTMTYEDRASLFGNLDIVLKFDESKSIPGLGSGGDGE